MNKNTKTHQSTTIVVPEGYDFEDMFDTDDSDFQEEPILIEEVNITFERNGDREKSGV